MVVMKERKSERLHLVITPSEVKDIDEWRRYEEDLPSRSEAIRRLIKLGMTADKGKKA